MKSSQASISHLFTDEINAIREALESIILGKAEAIKLVMTCLLANGHLLLEDVPGVGKTTLGKAIAAATGLDFQRIQFTNDLLPADVLGMSIYSQRKEEFNFLPGPIFSQLVLADEINRATPKSQSALLEAMEEFSVTVDGKTHPLPKPFFVIGTQNPLTQTGTYPLPESQLDRFLMKISLGYPDADAERKILSGKNPAKKIEQLSGGVSAQTLLDIQSTATSLHISEPAMDYLQALIRATRESENFVQGLSPRAGRGLLQAARAHALIVGREYVLPDDFQAVFRNVAEHRLTTKNLDSGKDTLEKILEDVPVA